MTEPFELSAAAAARQMSARSLSAEELLASSRGRILAVEPTIQAWASFDPVALGSAFLGDLPIGVKDIFHAKRLPTTAAFAPYADRRSDRDAAVISALHQRDYSLQLPNAFYPVGKTHTTQFAYADPAPTRNPWRADRTPGGSSAGSAAAVAARMVPLALGTQTAGSVLRPAAYCGVIGFKPTYGRFSTDGVIPLAWSLDHVGFICREVDDLALVLRKEGFAPHHNPTLGLVTDVLEAASPEVREHCAAQAKRLASWGARIVEVRLPLGLPSVLAIHHVTMQTEVAAVHAQNLERYREHYGPKLRAYVDVGQLLPGYVYQHAQRLRAMYRQAVDELFEKQGLDALLTPTASNVAPGRETTGDTRFQAIWTLIGIPSISLPSGLSAEGLPFALQLAGMPGQDERLLAVAKWCEQVLGRMPPPPEPFGASDASTG